MNNRKKTSTTSTVCKRESDDEEMNVIDRERERENENYERYENPFGPSQRPEVIKCQSNF